MSSRNKAKTKIPLEQHEQLEYAQQRIIQKKKLYRHFVFFLVGSLFFVVLNKAFHYGGDYDWYLWAILAWLFLLFMHTIQVFFLDPFMGQEWERKQREQLVAKQQERIAALQKEVQNEMQDPDTNKKKA
ncbi:2TM domain-containing protein [Lentiprolixibacter aurantiacus]|uniref:2TM domain-containing protein n=1 Tax=Lentiprolixibacter aurantiacus TaxID=2993939 RepID=A0AAE3MKQ1_9FLAO|nr:2TM domain-containing protein [Lentiprolixibacter aurantiacus]